MSVEISGLDTDGGLDFEDIESKINSGTRLIYLDNPGLTTGKQFSESELDRLSFIVRKHEDLFVISNESHFSNLVNLDEHFTFANLPGMWGRTFSIYSTTTMFGTPGLRVGWMVADKSILKHLATYQAYAYFATSTTAMVNFFKILVFNNF